MFVCLRLPGVELPGELREHIRNGPSIVLVGAGFFFFLHVCHEDFDASGFDGSRVLEATDVQLLKIFAILFLLRRWSVFSWC